MKSIIALCTIFIMFSLVNVVVAYAHHKTRLYDLLRKSMNDNDDVVLFEVPKHQHSTTTAPVNEKSTSVENDDEKREALDSGEDQYFQWASLNRRPMESLLGRKRSAEPVVSAPRPTRIGGGIWRSGLVG